MKKKITLSLILIALLLPLTLFILEGDNKKEREFFKNDRKIGELKYNLPGKATGIEDFRWERENIFINDNNIDLVGRGYDIKNLNEVSKEDNINPVKILIFGDGYIWGNANTDRSSTITVLLQKKLDAIYGKKVTEVKLLSNSAAGTFTIYDYFKKFGLKGYKPDLVIYSYFDNDFNPSFNESLICRSESKEFCDSQKNSPAIFDPKYQDCIHGEGDSTSQLIGKIKNLFPKQSYNLLIKKCAPLLEKAKKNPYNPLITQRKPFTSNFIELWEKTMGDLRNIFKEYDAAVFKPVPFAPSIEDDKKIRNVFVKSGWDNIPLTITEKYFKEHMNDQGFWEDIKINQSIGYPSSILNNLNAQDMVNYITKKISKEKIENAKKTLSKDLSNENLVSYTMPVYNVKNNYISSNESEIIFDKSLNKPYNQDPDGKEELPFQHANCMNHNSANFLLTLNSEIKSGNISLSGLPKNEKIKIGLYYYGENAKRMYKEIGDYRENMVIKMENTTITNVIAIIFENHSKNCPVNKEISAPDFKVSVKKVN